MHLRYIVDAPQHSTLDISLVPVMMRSACAVPKGAAKRADLLEKHTEERGQLEYIGKALDTIKKEMHDPATPAPRVQHLQHQFMAVPVAAYCA